MREFANRFVFPFFLPLLVGGLLTWLFVGPGPLSQPVRVHTQDQVRSYNDGWSDAKADDRDQGCAAH